MVDQKDFTAVKQMVADFNTGNFQYTRNYLSPNFFNHVPEEGERDAIEVFMEFLTDLRQASSDLQVTLENLTAEADVDVIRGQMCMCGFHDGPIWGVPPTGKWFEMRADIAIRCEAGGRYALALENLAPPQIFAALGKVELLPASMDQPPPHPVVFPEIIFKVIFTGQAADRPCSHLDMIKVTEPTTDVCQQCVESGDVWPALRMCLVCGFVGCCDTSVNKHMKAHYLETGHPIFRSIRMKEGWVWCYEDNAFFEKYKVLG